MGNAAPLHALLLLQRLLPQHPGAAPGAWRAGQAVIRKPMGRPLPTICCDPQFAAGTRLRQQGAAAQTPEEERRSLPWAGKGPQTGEEGDKFRSDCILWQTELCLHDGPKHAEIQAQAELGMGRQWHSGASRDISRPRKTKIKCSVEAGDD